MPSLRVGKPDMGGSKAEKVGRSPRSKPVLAALLSALVPGIGQWFAGRRLRAAALFAPLLLLLLAAGIAWAVFGLTDIAALLVQPRALWALLGGNVVVLGWRLFAVADAYAIAKGSQGPGTAAALSLGGIVLAVSLPHLIAGAYGYRGIDLLESVFAAPKSVEVLSSGVTLPQANKTTTPETYSRPQTEETAHEYQAIPLIFVEGVGDPEAVAAYPRLTASGTLAAPFLPFSQRVDDERITVLLAGGDEGPGREGLRTDTMIVATVNVTTGQAALFGIPRNFRMVPLPRRLDESFVSLERVLWEQEQAKLDLIDRDLNGFPDHWTDLDGDGITDPPEFESCKCFPEILNALHGRADQWFSRYPGSPDPGMEALADTIENLLDLHVDYWTLVNMEGFVKLIDAMGGVDVMVASPMHVTVSAAVEGLPKASISVEPGLNHLSGSEALAYVRWRWGSSDYARMQRQRCMLRAVAAQADPVRLLRSFTTIADALETSVVTNIPLTFLPDMVQLLARIDFDDIATVGFVPPVYNDGRTPGGYPIPDVDRIRWKVDQVLAYGAESQSSTGESECP